MVIACQGGGSHTAFTAGVLKRLLGANELTGYQVSGLSGTSGGAVCALLAWYALLDDDPAGAGRLLDRFWTDNSARGPVEMLVNAWVQWAGGWQDLGGAVPAVSPYHWPASKAGPRNRLVSSPTAAGVAGCSSSRHHTSLTGTGGASRSGR